MTGRIAIEEDVPVADLIPYARNANKGRVDVVAASLKEYGYVKTSIGMDEGNVLLYGHTTLAAAKRLKWKAIPKVARITGLTAAQKKAYRLMDNRSNQIGEWDTGALQIELDDLKLEGFDLDLAGFDAAAMTEILGAPKPSATEDDYTPPPEIVTDIRRGDLIRLGRHFLLCGDSTSKEDVAQLMQGKKADINVITDPPYNIGFKYNQINDKKSEEEYKAFCSAFFKNISELEPKAVIITPGPRNEALYPTPKDKGIWVKKNATAGASVFHLRLCEPILFYGDFKEKRNTDLFEYSSGFTQELKDARSKSGVLEAHAPAKAIGLWSDLINMLSDGPVLDPFLGNGTTLIACEQLGRTCYGMEISPQYCEVICQRWEKLTGQQREVLP